MLSYQHAFHAGNHADILKHYVLCSVFSSLNSKSKPYTFFDTHAGSGLYDLLDNRSQKTGEGKNGILRFLKTCESKNLSDSVKFYVETIKPYADKNFYPGSPEIEKNLLLKDSILVLNELHPKEIENLKKNIHQTNFIKSEFQKNIQIHNRDAWEMILALTPPKIKRGGILIDPSYEEKIDYENAAKTVCEVHKKWPAGIIILWYPLIFCKKYEIENMIFKIKNFTKNQNSNTEIIQLELKVNDENSHKETLLSENNSQNPPRLYGSGILVINATWKLIQEAKTDVEFLEDVLRQN